MQRHTVLVVDDSAFMRKIITDLITEDSEFTVVDTAKNGVEAIKKVREWKPDIITMDVEMPLMNGLEALREIMKEMPTPVVMLSSLTDEGARETIAALELGAVDFVRKPSGSISLDLYKVKDIILEKLRIAVRAKVNLGKSQAVIHRRAASTDRTSAAISGVKTASLPIRRIVAIGTSTGGPRALQTVLSALPANLPAPIVVVQHMPPKFTRSLAERLDSLCELNVVEAEADMTLEAGTVYIAPGGYHMKIGMRKSGVYHVELSNEPPRSGHRPSVDMLFESLIPYTELERYGIIMTGMGSDGASGMLKLKQSGAAATIAESEETCIVYGMPRAAAMLNAIDHHVKLHDIPKTIIDLLDHQQEL